MVYYIFKISYLNIYNYYLLKVFYLYNLKKKNKIIIDN